MDTIFVTYLPCSFRTSHRNVWDLVCYFCDQRCKLLLAHLLHRLCRRIQMFYNSWLSICLWNFVSKTINLSVLQGIRLPSLLVFQLASESHRKVLPDFLESSFSGGFCTFQGFIILERFAQPINGNYSTFGVSPNQISKQSDLPIHLFGQITELFTIRRMHWNFCKLKKASCYFTHQVSSVRLLSLFYLDHLTIILIFK